MTVNLNKAKTDLDYFSKEFFGMELFPWQKEIAAAPQWQKVIIKGRGAGGSFLGRKAIAQFSFMNRDSIVLWIANAKHQVIATQRERIFLEFQNSKLSSSIVSDLKESIRLTNGSVIYVLPNSPESIRGYQPVTTLRKSGRTEQGGFAVVIEEGCFIENIKEVLTSLTYPLYNTPIEKRMFWIISSPAGKNSPIYPLYKQGLENDDEIKSFTAPSNANPLFKGSLDKLRKSRSEAEYAMEIEGKFIESVGNFFAGILQPVDYVLGSGSSPVVSIGVDLSLSGSKHGDFTAISVIGKERAGNDSVYRLLDLKARKDYTMKDLMDLIAGLYAHYKANKVVIEVYQGSKLVEDLRAKGINAELIHPTSEFQNINFHKWRALLENNQFLISDQAAELLDEMSDFTYQMTASGKKTFGHQSSGHDDRVYATLYALSGLLEESVMTDQDWDNFVRLNDETPTLLSTRGLPAGDSFRDMEERMSEMSDQGFTW
jgi:phage terminase large subunit-like protein